MGATPQQVRLVVIGCGGIANAYLQALPDVAELQLVAVVEPDAARREQVAQRTGVPAFPGLPDLLRARAGRQVQFDAALVLTPPNTHEAITVPLLGMGLHVLCEKPLCTTVGGAQRMVDAAARAQRLLMMGSKFRYVADMLEARRLLEKGTIGEVVLFENVFCARVDMTRRWNGVRAIAGGGVLIDNGSHSVDVARYLLGPIARVQAQFGVKLQTVDVEDTARLLFEARTGAVGAVDLSWSINKEVPSFVRVYGQSGVLEIGWKQSRYKREGDGSWTVFGDGYDKTAAFRCQLRNFARAALGLEKPLITAEDALASVHVIDAAYRSARERRWEETTPVATPPDDEPAGIAPKTPLGSGR